MDVPPWPKRSPVRGTWAGSGFGPDERKLLFPWVECPGVRFPGWTGATRVESFGRESAQLFSRVLSHFPRSPTCASPFPALRPVWGCHRRSFLPSEQRAPVRRWGFHVRFSGGGYTEHPFTHRCVFFGPFSNWIAVEFVSCEVFIMLYVF